MSFYRNTAIRLKKMFGAASGVPQDLKHKGENPGYCHCCRKDSIFKINDPWLRDHYLCLNCGSIPRQRHIQYILDSFFQGWEDLAIHESSPSNGFISQYCRRYSSSQYFEKTKPGALMNGVRSENLESLTFQDSSFDLFITQDVLEHVFNPDYAMREIMRVLKPGGCHVFTAPKHKGLKYSAPRAALSEGRVIYLKDAMFHGNPIGDGKALVTWDYGDDFESLIHEWINSPTVTYVTRDRSLGLDGEYLEVFVTRKR